MSEFKDLKGKTLVSIERIGDEELFFTCSDGDRFKMYHDQDCCENVEIDDINGDLNDLIGSEIIVAEERTSEGENPIGIAKREFQDDSFTWTFYTIRTIKTSIDIRWYGESNGYYSESVDFAKAKEDGTFDRW